MYWRKQNKRKKTTHTRILTARERIRMPGLRVNELGLRFREILFIVSFAVSAFIFFALLTYHHNDPSWSYTGSAQSAANLEGVAGAWIADLLLHVFGYVAYVLPVLLLYSVTASLLRSKKHNLHNLVSMFTRCCGFGCVILASCGLASLHATHTHALPAGIGGMVGEILGNNLRYVFNVFGSTLLLFMTLGVGISLFTDFSWLQFIERLGARVRSCWQYLQRIASALQPKLRALFNRLKDDLKARRNKPWKSTYTIERSSTLRTLTDDPTDPLTAHSNARHTTTRSTRHNDDTSTAKPAPLPPPLCFEGLNPTTGCRAPCCQTLSTHRSTSQVGVC